MIQLNLLPDVKLEYIKAQQTRRLAMAVSFIVTAAAIAILVLMLSVESFQKHTLGNLNKDVASGTSKLQGEPQINSVLTVQTQLQSINNLYASEPAASRLFDYLNELTPTPVTIGNLAVDYNAHTLSISGAADALSSVDQFIDTLKFTNYSTGANTQDAPAFNSVVLSAFSLDNTTSPPADYTITANFDPAIFDVTKNVTLVIPTKVTTRSSLEHPGPLFVKSPSHTGSSSTTASGGGQ
jgi:Tfp pilus assembly protein PilN